MKELASVVALVAVVVTAGCARTAPILNVTNQPTATAANKPLTQDQVRGAIVRAGAALGWHMKDEAPGKLTGTLILRTHTAVVDIAYSPAAYSIQYKSSIDLKESGGTIHSNYNGWIQNLTRGINAQLSAI